MGQERATQDNATTPPAVGYESYSDWEAELTPPSSLLDSTDFDSAKSMKIDHSLLNVTDDNRFSFNCISATTIRNAF